MPPPARRRTRRSRATPGPRTTGPPDHAPSSPRSVEDPAPLRKRRVDVGVEGRERLLERGEAPDGGLGVLGHERGDALPLRDLRRRADGAELRPERPRPILAVEGRCTPRALPCGQISRELVEPHLLRRRREELDEAPRGLL